MRHVISAALYTLIVVMMLVMTGIYLIGEYTEGAFLKEFWWVYLILIAAAVVGAYLGEPERFPRILQPKHKRKKQ